uniref:Lipoprotein, putative n=1 Tax=Geobacter sp. (strain M21) TaxID=443144 RepID=C6E9J7_GEOSM
MKKGTLLITMLVVSAVTMAGCATSGDLARVETQERAIGAKADQALQEAQAAKATADAAKAQADAAALRAENAAKAAEERERLAAEKEQAAAEREKVANEKGERADAAFYKSMRK